MIVAFLMNDLRKYLSANSISLEEHDTLCRKQPCLLNLRVLYKRHWYLQTLVTLLAVGILIFSMVFKHDYVNTQSGWSITSQQFINVTERPIFVLGLILLVLPCFIQISPCFSRVLSCYLFQLISFFAYPIFLFHYLFLIIILFSAQRNGVFGLNPLFMKFFAVMTMSILASVFA